MGDAARAIGFRDQALRDDEPEGLGKSLADTLLLLRGEQLLAERVAGGGGGAEVFFQPQYLRVGRPGVAGGTGRLRAAVDAEDGDEEEPQNLV